MPAEDQAEDSPPTKKKNSRANGKDGAIELCFELLSSGRRLDEILAELGSKSGATNNENSDLEGSGGAIEKTAGPSLTELLIKRAKASVPLPAHEGEMERRRLAETVAAGKAASSVIAGATAAPRRDIRLPVVQSEITSWGQPADDRRIGPAPLAIAGWRRIARLIGALLVFTALIAAAPSVTYELLRVTHGATSVHSGAGNADKPPVAPRRAQIPAAVLHDAPNRASATAVAETEPLAPRASTAAARPSPPVAPVPARSAPATRRIPPPATAAQPIAPASLAPIAAEPHAAAPASASKAPEHLAASQDGVSEAKAKTAPAAANLSASEVAALVARGDTLFAAGDVTNARLFYQRGADGGNGPAALRLGESFDPAFLTRAGLGYVTGDAKQAAYWYRRAHDLGVRAAALLLQGLKPAGHQ